MKIQYDKRVKHIIKSKKRFQLELDQFCRGKRLSKLVDLCRYVSCMEYEDEPDYEQLRLLLGGNQNDEEDKYANHGAT